MRLLRKIHWSVVIPTAIGSVAFLFWVSFLNALVHDLIANPLDPFIEHMLNPRKLVIRLVSDGNVAAGAIIFLVYMLPFICGILVGWAGTRRLAMMRRHITIPFLAGVIVGVLYYRSWRIKS